MQVFGVKIILQDKAIPVTQDLTIGLYNVAGDNSEFRWIQNTIDGVTWCSRMLVEKGIKRFSLNIDISQKGNISYPGRGEVVVRNDEKFWQAVEALGIDFTGLKAEIYLFNGTTPQRIRTYACDQPTYDSREYRIPLKGMQEVRVTNIMNIVTSAQFPQASKDTLGKIIPATFGRNYPAFNTDGNMIRATLAKFIRVLDKQEDRIYSNAYFSGASSDPDIIIFPVIGYSANEAETEVDIEIKGNAKDLDVYPKDVFMFVVDGTASVGEIRQVIQIHSVVATNEVIIYLDSAFSDNLNVADDTNRSWVCFRKISREYLCDHWQQKSFLDDTGANKTDGIVLYSKGSDDVINRIAPYAFSAQTASPTNNKLKIEGKAYDDDINNLSSEEIIPITNLELEKSATLANWNNGTQTDYDDCVKMADGIYNAFPVTVNLSITISNIVFSSPAAAYDKQLNTYAEFSPVFSAAGANYGAYYKVLKFTPPPLPKNISIDKICLGIKAYLDGRNIFMIDPNGNSPFFLVGRRFAHTRAADRFISDKVIDNDVVNNLNDLPHFYTGEDGNSFYFFKANSAEADSKWNNIYGYTNFDLGLTKEQYEAIIEFGIFNHISTLFGGPGDITPILRIHELAIIIKTNDTDIGKEVLSPTAGRTFAYTWQGRKMTTDLIEKPADIIEHVGRLQNYRDTCFPPVSGWGLQYADAPLIGTAGWGSFDDPDLAAARDYCAAAQLIEEEEGYTDRVKQAACRDFAIANWQDKDGEERIIALPVTPQAPVYTVTMRDVIDRNRITVLQKKQDTIFTEPTVRFQKNVATGEYEKILSIKNTSNTLYLPSYVSGIENAGEAEALWRTAHSLALKTHQINEPPTDLTDLTFANGAGGYTIAYKYLKNWLDWQLATDEIEFPLHVNTCVSWEECTPINLVFSHQTNNTVRHALVEEIEIEPNTPYEAMIKAIMYA